MPDRETVPLPPHLQELVNLLPLGVEVHRTTLEATYGRQEVKRRLRKIRAEYGWEIKSERRGKGANDDWYTRLSDGPVREQHIRKEVKKSDRLKVYQRDGWTCQFCKTDVSPDQTVTNPQCDHKIPAERGGPTQRTNLQTLCTRCNLKKRQACKHCSLPTCVGCPYAYPEAFDAVHVIALPQESADKLIAIAQREGIPPAVVIARLLDAMP